jgi:hypothetical protein
MTLTGSTLTFTDNTTFTDATNTWVNFTTANSTVLTLSQATTISGNLTISGSFTLASNNLTIGGSYTGNYTFYGTAGIGIIMNGTGTFTSPAKCGSNVTFNTAGTITLSGRVVFFDNGPAQTITYSSGTLVGDGTEFLVLNGDNANLTMHLPTTLSIANLAIGPYGTSNTMPAGTIIFDASKTINVSGMFIATGSTVNYPTGIKSGTPGVATNINITGNTLPIAYNVTATDINSSGGKQVLNIGGTNNGVTSNWITAWNRYNRTTAVAKCT